VRAFVFLLGFLALLAGGGAYNYHRNAYLDEATQFRPYRGLSDADLQTLLRAYESRHKRMQTNFAGPGPDVAVEHLGASDLGGKVKAFDHFEVEHQRWKEGRREMLGEEVTVDSLRKEQALRRQGLDNPWTRILRRATTL
jgi:hypothetical protein